MVKLIWDMSGETEFVKASEVSSCKIRESLRPDFGDVPPPSYHIDVYTKYPHTKNHTGGTIPSLVIGPYEDKEKAISRMRGIAALVEVTDNG